MTASAKPAPQRPAYFVAAVEHADGYNGHRSTAYVCFDHERNGCIAVYPHGWHTCPPDLAHAAVRINAAALRQMETS